MQLPSQFAKEGSQEGTFHLAALRTHSEQSLPNQKSAEITQFLPETVKEEGWGASPMQIRTVWRAELQSNVKWKKQPKLFFFGQPQAIVDH
ncbi:MAG: hypothetical protein H8E37_12175 [Planctomycetes bacterium]|nr:hypothetical protein [Planctomycetota bacterium]